MKATIHLLTLSAAVVSGCASSAAAPPRAAQGETFIGYVTPHVGASARDTYKVTTGGITSSQTQIARVDEGFRGVVRQRPIDLRVEADRVTGSVGSQPIDLRIEHRRGKLRIEGLYGGRLTGFFFSETPASGSRPCGENEPWISISTEDAPAPVGCDVESVRVLQVMRTYLDENDAAALLAVMVLSGPNGSSANTAPPASRSAGGSGATRRSPVTRSAR